MNNRYYSLTFRTPCLDHKFGDRIKNADYALTIGQKSTADIQLPCTKDLIPKTFATILPDVDQNYWYIVRRTDYYDIKVNDESLCYAKILRDGDIITFDTLVKPVKLLFHVCDDECYSSNSGIIYDKVRITRKSIALYSLLMLILVFLISLIPFYLRHLEIFSDDDTIVISRSVYQVNVDSVMLQMHTPDDAEVVYCTIDSRTPDKASYGTCFFTKDSLCITARHCVEPWLAYEGWTGDENVGELPIEVQWAIRSEQSIEEESDTLYRVVAYCNVMDGDSCIYSFTSDQCKINRSRDIITHLGPQQLPWRVIFPMFSRKEIELGDFAFIKILARGELELAGIKEIKSLLTSNVDCRLVGYPKENTIKRTTQDCCILDGIEYDDAGKPGECIRLEVRGNDGNSGGPVIVKHKGRIYVVGILSKRDDHHDGIFFAVPSTEITNFTKKKDETTRYKR